MGWKDCAAEGDRFALLAFSKFAAEVENLSQLRNSSRGDYEDASLAEGWSQQL